MTKRHQLVVKLQLALSRFRMPEARPNSNPPSEKPHHYSYLKGFRTEQCQPFQQHKCTQHRPYTCFNWHFANQRRRRPRIRRDGTFNYSADVYCTQYDETSGSCPNGDDCRCLHRNNGDTERRYHLRYYKTATCVYDTDSKGHCTKNGAHCCFAHCAEDLRQPVFDGSEGQEVENGTGCGGVRTQTDQLAPGSPPKAVTAMSSVTSPILARPNLERDRSFVLDDVRWHDQKFVLLHYKTELCKKPPRSCRQGYACPYYHNERDRRRSPRKHKYRSTPCPHVKHGDEWGEPSECDKGDNCSYCHTRTEQQFHPEIYKSTKCYDVLQTKSCPRGPFCAFAHREEEMKCTKDLPDEDDLVGLSSPAAQKTARSTSPSKAHHAQSKPQPIAKPRSSGSLSSPSMESDFPGLPQSMPMYPRRSSSTDAPQLSESLGSLASSGSNSMINTVGEEDLHQQVLIRKQLIAIDNDPSLPLTEKARRKHNVMQYHSTLPYSPDLMSPASVSGRVNTSVSDPFDIIGGQSLDEEYLDPTDDLDIREIEKEIGKVSGASVDIPDSAERSSHASSLSSSLSSSYTGLFGSFGIPVGPITPPFTATGPLPTFPSHVQTALVSPKSFGPGADTAFLMSVHSPVSKTFNPNNGSGEQSPASASPYTAAETEIRRLRDELKEARGKLVAWEDSWMQAKQSCDIWKKEASENAERSRRSEEGRIEALAEKKKLIDQLRLIQEKKLSCESSYSMSQSSESESSLEQLPLSELVQLQQETRVKLDRLDKLVSQHLVCSQCQERARAVFFNPCSHCIILCEMCSEKTKECLHCGQKIHHQTVIPLPL